LSFAKKKDAEAEFAKRVSLIDENRYLDVKKECKITLGELIRRYAENFKDQRSFNNWKVFCIVRWKEYFGEATLLSNVRYVDLEGYRNHLLRTPTQHGTIRTVASTNREISALYQVFTKAVEWELIEKSPFAGKKSLLLKETNKRYRFLTEKEIAALLDDLNHPSLMHVNRIVETALLTGMRKGEILSLK
jgi:integrase